MFSIKSKFYSFEQVILDTISFFLIKDCSIDPIATIQSIDFLLSLKLLNAFHYQYKFFLTFLCSDSSTIISSDN